MNGEKKIKKSTTKTKNKKPTKGINWIFIIKKKSFGVPCCTLHDLPLFYFILFLISPPWKLKDV